MKVMKNPEYDYSLTYEDTKTLGTYHELKDKAYNAPVKEFGIFFAFDDKQFNEGFKECGYTDLGQIRKGPGGGFGSQEAWDKLSAFYESIDKEIAEKCDPFEVFCYEYNNYENCFSFGIKEEVKDAIGGTFGKDALKDCLKKFNQIKSDRFVEF